jgi:hypothetical protein
MSALFSAETKKSIQVLSDLVDDLEYHVYDLQTDIGDLQVAIAEAERHLGNRVEVEEVEMSDADFQQWLNEAEKAHQQEAQD